MAYRVMALIGVTALCGALLFWLPERESKAARSADLEYVIGVPLPDKEVKAYVDFLKKYSRYQNISKRDVDKLIVDMVPNNVWIEKVCEGDLRKCDYIGLYYPDEGGNVIHVRQQPKLPREQWPEPTSSTIVHELTHWAQGKSGLWKTDRLTCSQEDAAEVEAYAVQYMYLVEVENWPLSFYIPEGYMVDCASDNPLVITLPPNTPLVVGPPTIHAYDP